MFTTLSRLESFEKPMNSVSYRQTIYTPNPSKSWAKQDEGISKYYVYILKLDHGEFYVGQTRELEARMFEHTEGMIHSTTGENPKLKYFEILPTRERAMSREHEIKILIKKNRREVVRMITEFHSLISKVDKGV